MPLYEYVCADCKKVFDKLISASLRDEEQQCPHCGGIGQRKMSLVAKGKGSCGSCSSTSCSTCSSGPVPT